MLQAIGKNVLVKAVYPETQCCGALILKVKDPDPIHYEVLSVGEDVKGITVGDKLPFPQYTNQVIIDNSEKVFVISVENITSKIID